MLANYLIVASLLVNGLANGLAEDLVIPFSEPRFLVVQGNGQFLAGTLANITRFNANGAVDNAVYFPGIPTASAIENDGTILVGNGFTLSGFNLDTAQQSAVGSLPLSAPPVGGPIRPFVLQPDGRIVAFSIDPSGSGQSSHLFRLNPDGTLDPSFASTVFAGSGVSPLALQEDGKIIGVITPAGAMARFNPNGDRDLAFAPPLLTSSVVNSIVVQADGKIIAGGRFQSAGSATRYGLLRLNADGTLDAAFNPASQILTRIDSIALQANGKILVSGSFNSIGGQSVTNLARLNPDGTLDNSFSAGSYTPSPTLSAPLIVLDDGAIVAGFATNLARITNPDVATQTLTRDGSTLTWLRGGSCPEIFQARFQVSLDGITWTDLGAARRVSGGWSLQNASIPVSARLRARGYVSGASYYVDYVPDAPALYLQPLDGTVNEGANFSLHVSAKGLQPLATQWYKDGQPLAGANSTTLFLTNVTGALAGGYSAVVSNSAGFSTTRVATLDVLRGIRLGIGGYLREGSGLALNATGPGSPRVILQMSTDLRQWTSLETNTISGPQWQITLTNLFAPSVFYRLQQTAP